MSVRPERRPSIDAQRIAAGLDSQIADGDWSEDREHKQQREAAVRIQAQRRGQCARRHARPHKKSAPRAVPPPEPEETGYHMSALSDAEVAREREQREERERQRRAEQQQAALRVQSAVRGKVRRNPNSSPHHAITITSSSSYHRWCGRHRLVVVSDSPIRVCLAGGPARG